MGMLTGGLVTGFYLRRGKYKMLKNKNWVLKCFCCNSIFDFYIGYSELRINGNKGENKFLDICEECAKKLKNIFKQKRIN